MQRRLELCLSVAALALSNCAYGPGKRVTLPAPDFQRPTTAVAVLHAGAAERDITPPPGLPTYGYGSEGVSHAKGYWLRLKARAIVLQQGVDRLAVVQLDLGAASTILHRHVAAELAKDGIGPQNLVLSTTHTHGGPGGYFGDRFYNHLVGARPAYDDVWERWLATQIVAAVEAALADMKPATLAVAAVEVAQSASHNRSRPAWKRNFDEPARDIPPKLREVDRTLTLVAIDRVEAGIHRPLAAWSIFAVHGTSMPYDYPFFHGDVHGAAARMLASWVEHNYNVEEFVAPTSTGAEGDVGPGAHDVVHQGKPLTMQVAYDVAAASYSAFVSLEAAMKDKEPTPVSLSVAFAELSMRGAGTQLGRLCQKASLGAPQLAGSEERRGPVYGAFGIREGATRSPSGCEATKVKTGGGIQDLVVTEGELPDVLPFQAIGIGDRESGIVLASFPGEPTTELGRDLEQRLRTSSGYARSAVLGLTNGYATYFTTPAEYLAQHYEGGASIYGPYEGTFAVEQLSTLAGKLEPPAEIDILPARSFQPGEVVPLVGRSACDTSRYHVGALRVRPGEGLAELDFTGPSEAEMCELPRFELQCAGAVLYDKHNFAQTDDGFAFELERSGGSDWTLYYTLPKDLSASDCRFVALAESGARAAYFQSDAFSIGGPK
ncbi:MAG: neutral/alkaline non-lysosomal ceramidase N-terminal domain-containing protein [Polyangiaceae bacterium]